MEINTSSNHSINTAEKNSEQSELLQFLQRFLSISTFVSQSQDCSTAEGEIEPLFLVCKHNSLFWGWVGHTIICKQERNMLKTGKKFPPNGLSGYLFHSKIWELLLPAQIPHSWGDRATKCKEPECLATRGRECASGDSGANESNSWKG